MANDPSAVMVDIFKIEIDTVADEVAVEVEMPVSLVQTVPITSGPTGTTVLAHNVVGQGGRFKIRSQQPTAARLLAALNVTGTSPPAVGTQLAGHVVKLTPFGDAGNTRTIKFYNVAFVACNLGKFGGKGNYVYEIECEAMRDAATGKVWEWAVA